MAAAPSLHLALLGSHGLSILPVDDPDAETTVSRSATTFALSPDGSFLALGEPSGEVRLLLPTRPADSPNRSATLPQRITSLSFSPHGAFLVARAGSKSHAFAVPGLEACGSAAAKGQGHKHKAGSPCPLDFAAEDSLAGGLEENGVVAYRSASLGDKAGARRLSAPGAASGSLSPTGEHAAVFVPERKGQPAGARLHPLPEPGAGWAHTEPLARRTFHRASSASLLWAASGSACLVWASSDVDATNRSYYGESGLHVMRTDGGSSRVELEKEGPVHDCAWAPDADRFACVHGFLPGACVTLFDSHGSKAARVVEGAYNGASFNRFGRFLCLYGFGNLPGDIVFHDRKPNGKYKPFGDVRVSGHTHLSWGPDGRHALVSCLSPRMREDNGIRLLKYTGETVLDRRYSELTGASFLPISSTDAAQHDRPPSPAAKAGRQSSSGGKDQGVYRPKHLRDAGAPPSAQSQSASYVPPGKRAEEGGNAGPPGSEGLPGVQGKNAKRRQRRKKKKEGGEDGDPSSS